MGILVSIAGASGNGKTHSYGTMDLATTMVFRPNRKPFSFPQAKEWNKSKFIDDSTGGSWMYTNDYNLIQEALPLFVANGKKSFIIDDSTHLIVNEFMNKIAMKGYDKFNELASNYYNLIKSAENLDDDVIVYVINHVDETNTGQLKIKTIGKLLDEKVDIPTFITICLQAIKTVDGYKFKTQTDGNDFFKSPSGMFADKYIPNDLSAVDKAIREYYGYD